MCNFAKKLRKRPKKSKERKKERLRWGRGRDFVFFFYVFYFTIVGWLQWGRGSGKKRGRVFFKRLKWPGVDVTSEESSEFLMFFFFVGGGGGEMWERKWIGGVWVLSSDLRKKDEIRTSEICGPKSSYVFINKRKKVSSPFLFYLCVLYSEFPLSTSVRNV